MRIGECAGAGLAPLRLAHVCLRVPGGFAIPHVGTGRSHAVAASSTGEAAGIATGVAVRIGLIRQSRSRRIGRRAVAANLGGAGAIAANSRRSRRDGGAGRRLQGPLPRRFEGVAARIGRARRRRRASRRRRAAGRDGAGRRAAGCRGCGRLIAQAAWIVCGRAAGARAAARPSDFGTGVPGRSGPG